MRNMAGSWSVQSLTTREIEGAVRLLYEEAIPTVGDKHQELSPTGVEHYITNKAAFIVSCSCNNLY